MEKCLRTVSIEKFLRMLPEAALRERKERKEKKILGWCLPSGLPVEVDTIWKCRNRKISKHLKVTKYVKRTQMGGTNNEIKK